MKITSVNIGQSELLDAAHSLKKTGIFKYPVSGEVLIDERGLLGDKVMDTRHHGGKDQAVYIYTEEDYEAWRTEHKISTFAGLFGENLTIQGLCSADVNIGDQLSIGEVKLEITAARIPCVTLSKRMKDPSFALKFRNMNRCGLYARVLQTGFVKAGDAFKYIPTEMPSVTIGEQFMLNFNKPLNRQQLVRLLGTKTSERMRAQYETALAKIS